MFPKWMNMVPAVGVVGTLGGVVLVVAGFWYWATPSFFEVGYMPTQPFAGNDHQIHAGKLGIDCRYCHTKVEQAAEANVPNVATCYGCHADGRLRDAAAQDVQWIRDAYAADESIPWRRVHKLPDYVRNFPHNIHVNAGVSCVSCHGMILSMPVVSQAKSLSMSWCLDCHRNPERFLVDPSKVTNLVWVDEHLKERTPDDPEAAKLLKTLRSPPPQSCGACHY